MDTDRDTDTDLDIDIDINIEIYRYRHIYRFYVYNKALPWCCSILQSVSFPIMPRFHNISTSAERSEK